MGDEVVDTEEVVEDGAEEVVEDDTEEDEEDKEDPVSARLDKIEASIKALMAKGATRKAATKKVEKTLPKPKLTGQPKVEEPAPVKKSRWSYW